MSSQKKEGKQNFQLPYIKPGIILFLLTAVCIVSMGFYYFKQKNIVSVTDAVGAVVLPFQKGINSIGTVCYNIGQEQLKLDDALEKIKELEADKKDLNDQIRQHDSDAYELQNLRKILELKDTYRDYESVGASVIMKSNSGNWFSVFTIDKGSDDGISVNNNVIADGGLVGIVTEVGRHHAIVKSIINDNVNVSAMQQSSEDACVVSGSITRMDEEGLLDLNYMDKDFSISRDTVIVTSNISDKYLPGIIIGYATQIWENSDRITCSGYIRPAVDFKHLSTVLVITTVKDTGETEEAQE